MKAKIFLILYFLIICNIVALSDSVNTAAVKDITASTNTMLRYERLFGDDVKTIGIVSVSSILDRKPLLYGIKVLKNAGYTVKVMPNVYGPKQAPVEVRARAFEKAWLDPEIDLLVFSRGGLGAVDVIQVIDWENLRSRNDMRVIGFSDVTFVVNTMLAKGVGHPLSGPNISSIGKNNITEESIAWQSKTLNGEELPPQKLKVLKAPGEAISGLGMAGLLERLVRLEELGLLPDMTGRIVFIESIKNHKKSAPENLQKLLAKGVFDKASAIVFCDFWAKDGTLTEFAKSVKCPVFSRFNYGHIKGSLTIDFRRQYFISPDGILTSPSCK